MAEKPIKVDERTDRIVTDLAHFLRSTKKAVVRDAVAEYAESRRSLLPDHAPTGDDGGIETLPPLERLALRRKDLIREFAGHRGTDVRVLAPDDEVSADDEITLLVETDLMDGWGAAVRLAEIASRLLGTQVTVISTTALRLTQPDRLRTALNRSRPL